MEGGVKSNSVLGSEGVQKVWQWQDDTIADPVVIL